MRPELFDTTIPVGTGICPDIQFMEFHLNVRIRKLCSFDDALFASSGNIIFTSVKSVQLFVQKYNKTVDPNRPEQYLKAGQLNAMGLIDEIFHYVCRQYRLQKNASFFSGAASAIEGKIGTNAFNEILAVFAAEFPPMAVYREQTDVKNWLVASDAEGIPNRILAIEELMLLKLANENPAFEPFFTLFSDKLLLLNPEYLVAWNTIRSWSMQNPTFGPEGLDLVSMLKAPVEFSPYNLKGQLDYIRTRWTPILGEWLSTLLSRLLAGIDLISEEEKAGWSGGIGSGTPDMSAYEFGDISKEYERFSPDREWMPNVVLLAKSVLVWLSQLTVKYGRPITRLDQIPDEELDFIGQAGFTGLWLIGLWERSPASARIKQICGNPEAAASAYSLDDYDIARELGGPEALDNLRFRAWQRGIRMASDMVPNHTGMDAKWVVEKPQLFVQTRDCPFPGYDFNGENLSHDSRVGIYLENHYYTKNDCAVVFKRVDNRSGDTRYIYHGNDGTGMPWNDTAQLDFLNPEAREAVIQAILHVARNFPIIRFDAAMVLAKKHIQRLWYPEPGQGGDIASRSQFALPRDEFERRIPEEFWREVVDRCAKEIPDTLLLAEAFWMMEGYFVRTLGMHRVYNSAFMNMLKREDNAKYRTTIKNTIEFDPEILKRYVNFMNNPDEETASVQFGNGDKYFGVCTMMVAMPGLPMFGHGQIEGFEEKYGMEYRRAYKNEQVNRDLVNRHRHEIFPLMKKRYLYAGVDNFLLYDFYGNGHVNENVFAWSNRVGDERSLILFNNVYGQTAGWVKTSAAYAVKQEDGSKLMVRKTVAEGLALTDKPGRFCVMQEQRSGLWYLRTTREIFDSGMYASLNGFQTQVFVNIHEVDDNEWGHYRTLYESLNGRGIRNVFMGIQNIYLKELYAALAGFASPAYFRGIRAIVGAEPVKGKDPVAAFIAETESPARNFFAVCGRCIDGNYGADAIPAIGKRKKAADADLVWANFKVRLEKLLRSGEAPRKAPAGSTASPAAAPAHILESLRKAWLAKPELLEVLSAAIVLYSLGDLIGPKTTGGTIRALADLWSLDLKMTDILADEGMDPAVVLHYLQTLKELLSVADTGITAAVLEQEKIRSLLGIHNWDGILWYNKETAEELVDLSGFAAALAGLPGKKAAAKMPEFSRTGWDAELAEIGKLQKKVTAAFVESRYQVEKLVAAFAPPVRTKKAGTAAKPAKDKAPAKAKTPAKDKSPSKKPGK